MYPMTKRSLAGRICMTPAYLLAYAIGWVAHKIYTGTDAVCQFIERVSDKHFPLKGYEPAQPAEKSEEYLAGYEAHDDDLFLDDNPFHEGSDQHIEWDRGWMQACDDYIDRKRPDTSGSDFMANLCGLVVVLVLFMCLVGLYGWIYG